MKTSTKHLRKVQLQNVRAFRQRGYGGLALLAETMGVPNELGKTLLEIGSSSIIDPSGHIARLKMAMNLQYSNEDVLWAQLGDTDASLYVGFQPGLKPTRVHPQLWLQRLAHAIPRTQKETLHFVDKLFASMKRSFEGVKTQSLAATSYLEPYLAGMRIPDNPPLFPLQERTLQ